MFVFFNYLEDFFPLCLKLFVTEIEFTSGHSEPTHLYTLYHRKPSTIVSQLLFIFIIFFVVS